MDRCWDSWAAGSSGVVEFLDLVGERKRVCRRAEVKSGSQEDPGESLWKAWDYPRLTETVVITTRRENKMYRSLRAEGCCAHPDISNSCMPKRVTKSYCVSFLLLLYQSTTS